jgi:hypothetical protein
LIVEGIEAEFAEANTFFLENNASENVLDLSCGSGFMTRRFIKSEKYVFLVKTG